MSVKISIVVWGCLLPAFAVAQTDSLRLGVKYYNSFVSGVMIGSGESAEQKEFTLSAVTLHGIKFNSGVKLGLGVGLDTYYDLKVFPLLISISVDQEHKPHGFFAQLNGGYSIVRYTKENNDVGDFYERGGFTISPMIGYRITAADFRIYWLAGYKYQAAEVGYEYTDWGGNPQRNSREYEFNRFVVQLGFGFR